MSAFSLLFEAVVAGLMIALIVYCVRLDRRLRALRENDSVIQALIGELRAASDRADAAVGALKAAGLEAERSLNQAIRTAQAVEDDLLRRGRVAAAVPASPVPPAAPVARAPRSTAPVAAAARPVAQAAVHRANAGPAAPPRPPARQAELSPPQTRSETELDLLRAIRVARAEGQG